MSGKGSEYWRETNIILKGCGCFNMSGSSLKDTLKGLSFIFPILEHSHGSGN